MLAGVSVLLEGVIGLLAEAVFHGVMEVLMKLLTGKFGVWWEGAVLWGLITLSIRRRNALGVGLLSRAHREGSNPSPHTKSDQRAGPRTGAFLSKRAESN